MQDEHRAAEAGDAPIASQQHQTGWMRAHVLVGQSYSLISVRYAVSAAGASGEREQSEPEAHDGVEFARYAMALAQALAEHGSTPRRLEVDAVLHARATQADAPWVELHVSGEAPGLAEASLASIATEVLNGLRQRGTLRLDVEARLVAKLLPDLQPTVQPQPATRTQIVGARTRWRRDRPAWRVPLPPRPHVVFRLPRPRLGFQLPRLRIELRLPKPNIELRLPRPRIDFRLPRPPAELRPPRPWLTFRLPRRSLAFRLRTPRIKLPARSRIAFRLRMPLIELRLRTPHLRGPVLTRGQIRLGSELLLAIAAALVAVSLWDGKLPSATIVPVANESPLTPAAPVTEAPDVAGAQVTYTPRNSNNPPAPESAAGGTALAPAEPAAISTIAVSPVVVADGTSIAGVARALPRTLMEIAPGPNSVVAWPNDPQSTAWLASDGYHLFARQSHQFVAAGVLADRRLGDVLVTATFHKIGGPPGGGYGIIVRDQGPGPRDGLNQGGRYYVLEVGDRGEVGIWRRDQDQWMDILPWTASSAAQSGTGENTLTVAAIGHQLTLSVNGTNVASEADAALSDGSVGVFLGGDQNDAVLTQLSVQAID